MFGADPGQVRSATKFNGVGYSSGMSEVVVQVILIKSSLVSAYWNYICTTYSSTIYFCYFRKIWPKLTIKYMPFIEAVLIGIQIACLDLNTNSKTVIRNVFESDVLSALF